LAGWTGLLNQGASRTQVALAIESSLEFKIVTVNSLYARYLNRVADPSGLSTFVSFLVAGGTIEQTAAFLVGSQEFLQGPGKGASDSFLEAVYQDALDRVADPFGRTAWKQALASGATPAQVAAGILASTEYRRDVVQTGYGVFLRRQAEPFGL